jgi:hypothetical protein
LSPTEIEVEKKDINNYRLKLLSGRVNRPAKGFLFRTISIAMAIYSAKYKQRVAMLPGLMLALFPCAVTEVYALAGIVKSLIIIPLFIDQ